jgi:DNA-binding NtrC family response regulator
MSSILVVDDNREFAEPLCDLVRARGYDVYAAATGAAALGLAAAHSPRLVFLDLKLPDMPGIEVLNRLRQSNPDATVVIVTGYPEVSSAVAAMRGRAVDYLCKPFGAADLDDVLRRTLAMEPSRRPITRGVRADGGDIPEMIGDSPATAALRDLVTRLGASGIPAALVTGESGTGKDLVARMFHHAGPRAAGPFVEVNCSAVTEALFESEFFGHERGAFTGAIGLKRGLAELADGGTLFLDEVGEVPLSCQAKLLRFLDDQSFLRVGGERKIKVDVHVIAATNRDLRAMVEQWTFRPDLYFRLNVVPIELAPLRARPEDILPLAMHYLTRAAGRYGKTVVDFTPEAKDRLLAYAWPGNVREVRNVVERLVILCPGERIDAPELPRELQAVGEPAAEPAPSGGSLEEHERRHIRQVLARVNGNKTKAAEILGISRQTLRTKLVK